MRDKYTFFPLLLLGLILPSALTEDPSLAADDVGTFAQKKCTQNEKHEIFCEDVNEEILQSLWPVGTYALPMSRHGCPESYLRGWREGHLSLTWRRPRTVYIRQRSLYYDSGFLDLTNVPLNGQDSMVFQQVTRNNLKIHFCYKYRHEPVLDVGTWPDGNYSIYGTNNSCPDDFESNLWNITLPDVSRWKKHGYTPVMDIIMGDPTTVQVKVCTKTSNVSAMTGMNASYYNELPFVLIKNYDKGACPEIQYSEYEEETLYIQKDLDKIHTNNSANMTTFQISCVYEPYKNADEYEVLDKQIRRAYSVHIANLTKGFAITGDYVRHLDIPDSTSFFFSDMFTPFRPRTSWTVVDLGRNVLVSAVRLRLIAGIRDEEMSRRILSLLKCTIGNYKWAFFYSNALSCFSNSYYEESDKSVELPFLRDMEGRFITLFDSADVIYETVSYIEVFTTHAKYDSTGSCNMDLGMLGREIADEAITASSWLRDFPPKHSRLYSSGWCADIGDEESYLQIDLPSTMVIEGITVYNWKSVLLSNQTVLESKFVYFGVHAFNISYKVGNEIAHYDGSEDFHIDTSRPLTGPHLFWFSTKIETVSIRIFVVKPLTEGLKCLRFELHGCKITGLYKVVNKMTRFRNTNNEVVSFVNEMFEDAKRISSLGYPLRYGGQTYIWIINLPEQRFIKLRFLDISLGSLQDALSHCNDTIILSRDITGIHQARVIDNTFNIITNTMMTRTLSVDTSVTSLVMALRTCTHMSPSYDEYDRDTTKGFTALLKSEHVPTCFSLHENIPWRQGLKEICRQRAMILTSMTYLGFPFRETTEEWTIHIPLHQIHLQIFQFLVYCLPAYSPSLFKVIDLDKESIYCNFNRPPDMINSTYDTLKIRFYKGLDTDDPAANLEPEGFRLVYTSSREKMEYLMNYHKPYSEIKNIALGKPAVMSSVLSELHPGLATDGIVHQELRGGSCFQTSYEYEPWWMVDLEGIYHLEYVVLYNRMDCCELFVVKEANAIDSDDHIRNVEISTGLSVNKLQSSGHICRQLRQIETIWQSGVKARYLRLTVLQFSTRFSLCEVQVYGQIVQGQSTQEETFTFPEKLHGNWGDWASWENICYCNRTQIRRRECNSPRPDYGGHSCTGSGISSRYCRPPRFGCPMTNIAANKPTMTRYGSNQLIQEHLTEKGCFDMIDKIWIWIMVDLEEAFNLDRAYLSFEADVLIQVTIDSEKLNTSTIEHLEISTGLTACDMEWHDYACMREYGYKLSVPLYGRTARYFKIQYFGLSPRKQCLELYGQRARYGNHDSNTECLYSQVDGGFSSWSNWNICSTECGHGVRTRFRTCNNPAPENGGKDCFGETNETQPCFGSGICQVCSDTFGKCYSVFLSTSTWNNAKYECLKKQMQLVSIFSIEELRFVKTLLRERRHLDGPTTNGLFSVSYYVHIGLRVVNPDEEYVLVWENNVLAHFLAWKAGQPSGRACTRMNFQSFTEDNTWESVDCDFDLAEYFICEHQQSGTTIATSSTNVVYNRKLVNVALTYSGKVCQRWDQQYPHAQDVSGDHVSTKIDWKDNYCRDILDNGYLWCFTTDPSTRWEACHIRTDTTVERKCNVDIYNIGRTNVTTSGKKCFSWNGVFDDITYSTYPELWTSDNYCRDPFNDGYAWCFVDTSFERGNVSKEICKIKGIESTQRDNDNNETIVFYCDNGMAIPYFYKCNGQFECKDHTDEIGCHMNYTAHKLMPAFEENGSNETSLYYNGELLLCPTNEWINIITLCDTVIDCFDASDETGCDVSSGNTNSMLLSEQSSCKEDQFQCDDGDCVHVSQVCDFIPDCIDVSDEYCEHDVCSSSEFKCDNGACISSELGCDAVRQCVDGSDEDNCDVCQANTAFHCDILRCIPNRLICDNYADCEDGTDELFCGREVYTSCKEWWNAGYRQNGQYIIEGILVVCDFHDYLDNGEIYTVIDTLDVYKDNIVGGSSGMNDEVIYLSSKYNCTQQIKMVCKYSSRNRHDDLSDICDCKIIIQDPAYSAGSSSWTATEQAELCPDVMIENISVTHYSDSYLDYSFTITHKWDKRYFNLNYFVTKHAIIQMGPAVCSDKAKVGRVSDDFSCAENGQIIPLTQKCIYDFDNAGFPLGCRDGSHLTNCENFRCPNNTVKCPGSYCIPVRFVCDGDIHCERGHDEDNCGCDASQSEILILYEKGTADELFISQFSRQFYTTTSIVRLLSFQVETPLKAFGLDSTQMLITDRQIDQRGDTSRSPECSYKVMSKDFLLSAKFANNGTKGLIYFENSLTSKEVADELFINLDDLRVDYKLYRVTQDISTGYYSQRVVSKVISVPVRRWKTLTAIGAEYFNALCKVKSRINCRGLYKCASSKTCIPLGQVCDGYRHCIHGDDELLCGFQCPDVCSCLGYYANCSDTGFRSSEIGNIPKTVRKLDFSLNDKLTIVLQQPLLDFTVLSFLNLSRCDIKILSRYAFNRLRNLQLLDISYNVITTLPDHVFSSLSQLKTLHIHGNYYLSAIHPSAFNNLFLISDLNLANSLLTKISANTFSGLKLKSIDLSNNRLENIEAFAFRNLSVNTINFEGNAIKSFNKETFSGVVDLKLLRTSSFKFCCIRPNYVDENNCFPTRDEFSSCEDLMRHSGLQFLLWLIGVLALLGNCLSLLYRLKFDRKRLKLGYGIFVTNLAAADFLMGVYLLIIAIADAAFRKRYIFVDDYWRGSFLCNLAGVLSTISSEASVLFLCLITLDRILVIKFPFDHKFFTTKNSVICVILAWLFSSFIAILPVAHEDYFQNKFYSRSGVCIALPLTRDRPPGWLYSILVFIVLNFITFLLVAIGQWSIFYEMHKSSGMAATAQSSRKRDLKVARNLLLVVATDFMCWFPIGVMGTMALSGYVISGDVYAWAAVFILPVNSALNPILYTLSAIIGGKDFRPSTKEHSREKKIKEMGENSLTLHKITRRLAKMDFPSTKYWSVYKISNEEIDIPALESLRGAAQLAEFLDVLHCSCLGIKSLDAKSVYFRIRNRKVLGDIKISGEPYVSVKPEDKTDDIYRLGLLLKKIIK